MRLLYILLFLLVGLKPAFSDSTLVFKNFSNSSSRSNSYFLKDNKLRLLEEHSELFNLYDKSKQSFSSINTKTVKFSRIDTETLNLRVHSMNKQRMEKLKTLEKQLKAKLNDRNDDAEKKVSESMLNQLKYPEMYGAHTLLKPRKTKLSKTINKISCDVYQILRKGKEIKRVCMADNQSLNINANDYETLRSFQAFNYTTQTRLMLAAGNTNFTLIDYQQENIAGIPIEIIDTSGETDTLEMMLLSASQGKLEEALFVPTKR